VARGVAFATLSHAAGLSSTGDPALDARLPFDEFYRLSDACAAAVERAARLGGRIVAIGTTVVRALEAAGNERGALRPGIGVARKRIGRDWPPRVVDAILTGVHAPGESHFELLRAFADDARIDRVRREAEERSYRAHEFGDSWLVERTRDR
jgi:S-adenosylmethionine:tRNA ribosyltransferase-isomerase